MTTFGSVIKEIRKNKKLTQKMLSEDICSQSVLSRIENDEELPNVVVMQQICQKLGVTMDQIMQFKSQELLVVTHIFEELSNFFMHKKFDELLTYMIETALEERIYLDTDWQRYYYYLGSCEFYLTKNYDKTLNYLTKSLSYTYQVNKFNLSEVEILIISCMGSTYFHLGNPEEAEKYLKKSLYYLSRLPSNRVRPELIKIFYNYADFLVSEDRIEEAKPYVNSGIQCAKDKCSYYYLADLFDLKSQICELENKREEAQEFKKVSIQIKQIDTIRL